MRYVSALDRIVGPNGISGNVFLIAPKHNTVTRSLRVLPPSEPRRGHDVGTTSPAHLDVYLLASDHDAQSLAVVALDSGTVVSRVHLASRPDCVRYVKSVNQIWVTEPKTQQIQVFEPGLSSPRPTLHRVGKSR